MLYEDIIAPEAPLEYFWNQEADVFGKSNGDVFTTLRKVDVGTDDSNFKVLPVGEMIKNGVKEVFSFAFKNIDAYLFLYLYPDGIHGIPNKTSKRAMIVRNRLFHKDPRFRNFTQWLFYHFDTMEKYRIVDNNARTAASAKKGTYTAGSVLSTSKYDFRTIFDDDLTTTVPIGIRGSNNYFRKIRGDLFAFIETFGNPHLFVSFSCDEDTWPGLKDYLELVGENGSSAKDNPVLSNHYCYERLQGMMKYIKNGYMGNKVVHHFFRFEFQKKGMVHLHALLWLDTDNIASLIHGISGQLPSYEDNPFLHLLVRRYQIHRCGNYCLGESRKCRFNFPQVHSNESYFDPENGNILLNVKLRI